MFIKRDIAEQIEIGAKQSPVIAIIGPRQSGKSTLVKELFKRHKYLDMQDAELFKFANEDPKGFLNSFKNEHGIIIDEAQYAPGLFGQIKVEADRDPKPGYFILSGSQNFLLHEKISESLAGRVYFYTLLPLSIKELQAANRLASRSQDQIFTGFYPRIYNQGIYSQGVDFHTYYQNYVSTYIERDIRSIRNIESIVVFQKFIQLCALRIGTTLNVAELATTCGISQGTANGWLALLESSFILFMLPSYHNNLGKRIIKSPKLYFYDVGLAANIMNVTKEVLLEKRDIYGALFENMIIVDIIKNFNSIGTRYNLSFYRDSNKKEVDLIIETGGKIIPVEIKASETIQSKFFETLTWFNAETKNNYLPAVIYGGDQNQTRSYATVLSWKDTFKIQA